MLTPDALAAIREDPSRATFRDVLVLVGEIDRLLASVAYWDERATAYERTLIDLIGALMAIRTNLADCQQADSCAHLEDARRIAIDVLAWKDAQA
jgi:ABC-type transporter Mla MlaB component